MQPHSVVRKHAASLSAWTNPSSRSNHPCRRGALPLSRKARVRGPQAQPAIARLAPHRATGAISPRAAPERWPSPCASLGSHSSNRPTKADEWLADRGAGAPRGDETVTLAVQPAPDARAEPPQTFPFPDPSTQARKAHARRKTPAAWPVKQANGPQLTQLQPPHRPLSRPDGRWRSSAALSPVRCVSRGGGSWRFRLRVLPALHSRLLPWRADQCRFHVTWRTRSMAAVALRAPWRGCAVSSERRPVGCVGASEAVLTNALCPRLRQVVFRLRVSRLPSQRQLPGWRPCRAISESKNAAGRHQVGSAWAPGRRAILAPARTARRPRQRSRAARPVRPVLAPDFRRSEAHGRAEKWS